MDNMEKIEISLKGDNNIELETISSFLKTVATFSRKQVPNDDPADIKVYPFETGSFKFVLDIIKNPFVSEVFFALFTGWITYKITLGAKPNDFKATKLEKGKWEILHRDGTTNIVDSQTLKLLKDKKLNADAKEFIKNYKKDTTRKELQLTNLKTKEVKVFPKKELIKIGRPLKIDTTSNKEETIRIWVQVDSFGYELGKWSLIPIRKIELTNSKAKIDATLLDFGKFNEDYLIDDNTYIAKKIIDIELKIEYDIDELDDKIIGNPKYYIKTIYDTKEPVQLQAF